MKIARVASKPSEILQVVDGTLDAEEVGHLPALREAAVVGRQVPPLGVRANADLPDQAELAYAFGARGIGLCRTEHMFFGEGRIPDRPADDPRRQRSRSAQGARRAAAAAARRLLRRLQGDARRAGHDPHDRSAAARVPAQARRADGRRRAARGDGARTGAELDEKRTLLHASSSSTSSTRCSAIAASGSASPIPKSPRCRRAPSSRRRAG